MKRLLFVTCFVFLTGFVPRISQAGDCVVDFSDELESYILYGARPDAFYICVWAGSYDWDCFRPPCSYDGDGTDTLTIRGPNAPGADQIMPCGSDEYIDPFWPRGGGSQDPCVDEKPDEHTFARVTIYGNSGNDFLVGHDGHDRIYGGEGDDEIVAYDEDDTHIDGDWLYGDGGCDEITGSIGDDFISLGPLNEECGDFQVGKGASGEDTLFGTAGRDFLYGCFPETAMDETDDNLIFGLDGIDYIHGSDGDDDIYGGDGPDIIVGRGGHDLIVGGPGEDWMWGDEGNDQLCGRTCSTDPVSGDVSDRLYGGSGDDFLCDTGRDVTDRFYGNSGTNDVAWQVFDGSGSTVADYSSSIESFDPIACE